MIPEALVLLLLGFAFKFAARGRLPALLEFMAELRHRNDTDFSGQDGKSSGFHSSRDVLELEARAATIGRRLLLVGLGVTILSAVLRLG